MTKTKRKKQMALQKTKKLRTGATGNYWKIKEIELDEGKGAVMLALYQDKETRNNPEMTYHELSERIKFKYTKKEIDKGLYGFIYGEIKKNDYFSDAINILEEEK